MDHVLKFLFFVSSVAAVLSKRVKIQADIDDMLHFLPMLSHTGSLRRTADSMSHFVNVEPDKNIPNEADIPDIFNHKFGKSKIVDKVKLSVIDKVMTELVKDLDRNLTEFENIHGGIPHGRYNSKEEKEKINKRRENTLRNVLFLLMAIALAVLDHDLEQEFKELVKLAPSTRGTTRPRWPGPVGHVQNTNPKLKKSKKFKIDPKMSPDQKLRIKLKANKVVHLMNLIANNLEKDLSDSERKLLRTAFEIKENEKIPDDDIKEATDSFWPPMKEMEGNYKGKVTKMMSDIKGMSSMLAENRKYKEMAEAEKTTPVPYKNSAHEQLERAVKEELEIF